MLKAQAVLVIGWDPNNDFAQLVDTAWLKPGQAVEDAIAQVEKHRKDYDARGAWVVTAQELYRLAADLAGQTEQSVREQLLDTAVNYNLLCEECDYTRLAVECEHAKPIREVA
jgi:hypothetical protein